MHRIQPDDFNFSLQKEKIVFFLCFTLLLVFSAGAQNTSMKRKCNGYSQKCIAICYSNCCIRLITPLRISPVSTTEGQFELKISRALYFATGKFGLQFHVPVLYNFRRRKWKGMLLSSKPVVGICRRRKSSSERIPILLKKDTIEYDAGAFKQLLMPLLKSCWKTSVQVDRNGNIKAQGEDVNNVLVDGKEFFSGGSKNRDQELAGRCSEKSRCMMKSRIRAPWRGSRMEKEKTINLELKMIEERLVRWSTGRWRYWRSFPGIRKKCTVSAGKIRSLYWYAEQHQSIRDFHFAITWISMEGWEKESFRIQLDDNVPVNLVSLYGKIASGCRWIQLFLRSKKDRRFSFNYLANGSNKTLDQSTRTVNYLASTSFTTNENLRKWSQSRASIQSDLKIKLIPQNLRMNAKMSLEQNESHQSQNGINEQNGIAENSQQLNSSEKSTVLNGNITLSYLKTWESKWKLVRGKKAEGTVNNKNWMMAGMVHCNFQNHWAKVHSINTVLIWTMVGQAKIFVPDAGSGKRLVSGACCGSWLGKRSAWPKEGVPLPAKQRGFLSPVYQRDYSLPATGNHFIRQSR